MLRCCRGVIGDALARNGPPDVTGMSVPRTGRSVGNPPGSRRPRRAFTAGRRQPWQEHSPRTPRNHTLLKARTHTAAL